MEFVKKSIDERALHKREYDIWVNERQMQTTEDKVDLSKALDASLVDTESSGTTLKEQDTSSRSGNDAHADDADIRPIYVYSKKKPIYMKSKPKAETTRAKTIGTHNFYMIAQNADSKLNSGRKAFANNGSKPKPRSNTQTSRNWPASKNSFVTTKIVPIAEHSRNFRKFSESKHFVCSTCQKCVFNANHDSCVTKFLNEVNSRAKVPSNKTTKRNKLVEQISVAKKPERQILKGYRFSIKNTSVCGIKKHSTPRSCLRWKPTGKNFKTASLRWVPTGKIFTSSTTKVDSEPINGSNEDITNQYECEQTLDVSACTLNLSAGTSFNPKKEGLRVCSELGIHDHSNEPSSSKLVPKVVPPVDKTATSRRELELLFYHHITMLRTDYEQLSQNESDCRGKENGLQIFQSIDQGPFKLGTTRDALRTTPEGGVLLGPERPRTYEDLSDTEKKQYDADVRFTQYCASKGTFPKEIYKLINQTLKQK
ncbi:hypothetical protein Tco_0401568 [Tanacetum coccineum]